MKMQSQCDVSPVSKTLVFAVHTDPHGLKGHHSVDTPGGERLLPFWAATVQMASGSLWEIRAHDVFFCKLLLLEWS